MASLTQGCSRNQKDQFVANFVQLIPWLDKLDAGDTTTVKDVEREMKIIAKACCSTDSIESYIEIMKLFVIWLTQTLIDRTKKIQTLDIQLVHPQSKILKLLVSSVKSLKITISKHSNSCSKQLITDILHLVNSSCIGATDNSLREMVFVNFDSFFEILRQSINLQQIFMELYQLWTPSNEQIIDVSLRVLKKVLDKMNDLSPDSMRRDEIDSWWFAVCTSVARLITAHSAIRLSKIMKTKVVSVLDYIESIYQRLLILDKTQTPCHIILEQGVEILLSQAKQHDFLPVRLRSHGQEEKSVIASQINNNDNVVCAGGKLSKRIKIIESFDSFMATAHRMLFQSPTKNQSLETIVDELESESETIMEEQFDPSVISILDSFYARKQTVSDVADQLWRIAISNSNVDDKCLIANDNIETFIWDLLKLILIKTRHVEDVVIDSIHRYAKPVVLLDSILKNYDKMLSTKKYSHLSLELCNCIYKRVQKEHNNLRINCSELSCGVNTNGKPQHKSSPDDFFFFYDVLKKLIHTYQLLAQMYKHWSHSDESLICSLITRLKTISPLVNSFKAENPSFSVLATMYTELLLDATILTAGETAARWAALAPTKFNRIMDQLLVWLQYLNCEHTDNIHLLRLSQLFSKLKPLHRVTTEEVNNPNPDESVNNLSKSKARIQAVKKSKTLKKQNKHSKTKPFHNDSNQSNTVSETVLEDIDCLSQQEQNLDDEPSVVQPNSQSTAVSAISTLFPGFQITPGNAPMPTDVQIVQLVSANENKLQEECDEWTPVRAKSNKSWSHVVQKPYLKTGDEPQRNYKADKRNLTVAAKYNKMASLKSVTSVQSVKSLQNHISNCNIDDKEPHPNNRVNNDLAKQMTRLKIDMESKLKQEIRQQVEAELQEKLHCCVCLEEPSTMVFVPCGHLVCCVNCGTSLQICPTCRTSIISRTRVYQ